MPTTPAQRRPSQRRLIVAGISTSTIEYYDFLLYGTMAALVFNHLFFPSFSPAAGTLAAFASFAFGFIARPIGSLIFGRLGDRIGRKRTLMISLALMGLSTLVIGIMRPTPRSGWQPRASWWSCGFCRGSHWVGSGPERPSCSSRILLRDAKTSWRAPSKWVRSDWCCRVLPLL